MIGKGGAGASILLALESSTPKGGVALFRDGEAVDGIRLSEGLRHGRDLMPAASAILKRNGIAVESVSSIAVSSGPGSYTGVRVGVMSAKALAYGLGCRLTAVSSLAALAATLLLLKEAEAGDLAFVAQNARRSEVYVGLYGLEKDGVAALAPDAALTPEEARGRLDSLLRGDERLLAAGSGFSAYPGVFSGLERVVKPLETVEPSAVAWLGWRNLREGKIVDPMLLQPLYLRRDGDKGWSRDCLIDA